MSDYFSFEAICKNCEFDLSRDGETGFRIMLPVGESVELTCPKCGTIWRFWLELLTHQEKIDTKRIKTTFGRSKKKG